MQLTTFNYLKPSQYGETVKSFELEYFRVRKPDLVDQFKFNRNPVDAGRVGRLVGPLKQDESGV